MGDFINLMGVDKWSKSEQLFWQLSPSVNNNLIHWMNNQDHPKMYYANIIHSPQYSRMKIDTLVPLASQNMNYIPALYKRSKTFYIPSRHQLSQQDGVLLAKILGKL